MNVAKRIAAVTVFLACIVAITPSEIASASHSSTLRRYPYLTDLVTTNVTINWATTTSATTGSVRYGRVGAESCTARTATATKTTITVGSTTEYQWKAMLSGLSTDSAYCYRVYGGHDRPAGHRRPRRPSARRSPRGSSAPYSFAVFGDWGSVDGGGNNADQAGC